ncbi:MAG: S9 family peptidase, partial [Pseudomonadota bacterium]
MAQTSKIRGLALTCAASLALAPAFSAQADNHKDTTSVSANEVTPPIAKKVPHTYTHHGITIEDPYDWLYDKSYPTVDDEDVLDYVKSENAYFEAQMEPFEAQTEALFEEMKARIKEDDNSVPQRTGDYLYWSAISEGEQYSKYYRKPVGAGDDVEPELLLDQNVLAEGLEYFRLGGLSVSKNGRFMAYSTDTNGSERYTAVIKDLETGEMLADEITGIRGGLTWVAGDTKVVYTPATEEWRTLEAKLHTLGEPTDKDVTLYKEEDQSFSVGVGLSAQDSYLIIAAGDNETSEVRFVSADDPTQPLTLVRAREKGVEYSVDMRDSEMFVWTNDDHINFRLAKASVKQPGEWETILEGSDDFYLTGFELFEGFFVTEGRLNGLDQVQIRQYDIPQEAQAIAFPEASYSAGLSNNPEYDQTKLRLSYESMITPDTVYDYDVATASLETLKTQEIPSGYNAADYITQRLEIEARDGTMVP